MEPTVHDVLAFHRVDRAAYDHLLSLGAGRRPARDAVALLSPAAAAKPRRPPRRGNAARHPAARASRR